jgi:histidinol-phosphate aminotransferase
MDEFWSDSIRGIKPYTPGEQPLISGLIKLNTNENPFPPSPRVIEAIRQAANDDLRLYPDPECRIARAAFAEFHGISPDYVFAGNSSDEVLALAFLGLLKHAEPILFPDVTYAFYSVYCRLYGIDYQTVPLDAEFRIDVQDYLRPNGGIVFPNPNAPTGRAMAIENIRRLLEANQRSVVVVDEAYVDFGAQSVMPLIAEFPNLLVIQTLSKSRSLAGLRIGFAAGHPNLIAALRCVKDSFNSYPLDRLALAGAAAALRDRDYFDETRRQVIENRAWLAAELHRREFHVMPSQANFVFARHATHDAMQLQRALRERKVLVRHFNQSRIEQYLRISIGTRKECEALVAALDDILTGNNQNHHA